MRRETIIGQLPRRPELRGEGEVALRAMIDLVPYEPEFVSVRVRGAAARAASGLAVGEEIGVERCDVVATGCVAGAIFVI